MTAAAFVVAALALGVSIAAAAYARAQAVAAQRMDRRDADRRHDERTPTFEAQIEEVNTPPDWTRLWLGLSPSTLIEVDHLTVEILDGAGVELAPSQVGVDRHGGWLLLAATWDEPLRPGAERAACAAWRVLLPDDPRPRPSSIGLRITSTSGAESWTTVIKVEVPPDVMASFSRS